MTPPPLEGSSRGQREAYVRERFRCRADCDSCGNCAFLKGLLAEEAYSDYIEGLRSFAEVSVSLRNTR